MHDTHDRSNVNEEVSTLKLPVALAEDGRIVHAHEGDRGKFTCPGCHGPVVWRRASDVVTRRAHFAHLGDGCGESAIHAGAKMMAARIINECRDGRRMRPEAECACRKCGNVAAVSLSPAAELAVTEYPLPSGRVVDVWCGYAIEIFYRHAVDEEKTAALKADGVSWVEICAEPLLEDPPRWVIPKPRNEASCVRCLNEKVRSVFKELAEARKEAVAATVSAENIIAEARKEAVAILEQSANARDMHLAWLRGHDAELTKFKQDRQELDDALRPVREFSSGMKAREAKLQEQTLALRTREAALRADETFIQRAKVLDLQDAYTKMHQSLQSLTNQVATARTGKTTFIYPVKS